MFFSVGKIRNEADRYILHSIDVARCACSQDSQGLRVSAGERAVSCNPTACSELSGISFNVVLLTKL